MLLIFLIHAIGDEYVGASMNKNMLVWTCKICMKHILLWSSPSSHTLLLLSFISNCCCWILRYSLCGLLWRVYKRQGRRPRSWKKFGTTHSRVGLVTLYVSRKSHVCSRAWCAWWLLWLELRSCVIVVENIMFMIIYARYC